MTPHNNHLHDHDADRRAEYDLKLEALTAEIRAGLNIDDHIVEIECDASFDEEISRLYRSCFKISAKPNQLGLAMYKFAQNWLDAHAAKLAVDKLAGADSNE